eukprot:6202990-Pleurochrysis_carterae.AAC.1
MAVRQMPMFCARLAEMSSARPPPPPALLATVRSRPFLLVKSVRSAFSSHLASRWSSDDEIGPSAQTESAATRRGGILRQCTGLSLMAVGGGKLGTDGGGAPPGRGAS